MLKKTFKIVRKVLFFYLVGTVFLLVLHKIEDVWRKYVD